MRTHLSGEQLLCKVVVALLTGLGGMLLYRPHCDKERLCSLVFGAIVAVQTDSTSETFHAQGVAAASAVRANVVSGMAAFPVGFFGLAQMMLVMLISIYLCKGGPVKKLFGAGWFWCSIVAAFLHGALAVLIAEVPISPKGTTSVSILCEQSCDM